MMILVKTLSVMAVTISLANADYVSSSSSRYEGRKDTGSTMLDGIIDGSKFKLSALIETIESPDSINGCQAHPLKPQPNVSDFIEGTMKATKIYACEDAKWSGQARFTTNNCAKAVACRQSAVATANQGDVILNEIIAKDFAIKSFEIYGDDMERLESLKRFAQKKYDKKIGSICIDRFQSEGKSGCNFDFMEEIFNEYQKKCHLSTGCFDKNDNTIGVPKFSKFKEDHKEYDKRYMREYYEERFTEKLKSEINKDDVNIKVLGKLVESPKFQALSIDKKIEQFVSTMGVDDMGRLEDPILGYDLGTDSVNRFQTSDKFKELVKLISMKDIKSEDFEKKFSDFRKARAEALLNDKNKCNDTPTFIKICSETTQLLKGNKVYKNSRSVERLSSSNTIDEDSLKQLKRYLGPGFDEKYYETLVNAKRCISFGITDEYGHFSGVLRPSLSASDMDPFENLGINSAVSEASSEKDPSMTDVWKSAGGSLASNGDIKDKDDKIEPAKISEADKVEPYNFSSAQPPVMPAANNFNQMYNANAFDPFADKDKEKADGAAENKGSSSDQAGQIASSSQDKMNDYLMKKLAATEENLAKLKADTEAADADREKQKKVDEETALIKDLKGQISDLKTQTAKNVEAKKAAVAAEEVVSQDRAQKSSVTRNNASSASINSTRSDGVVPTTASENYDSARNTSSEAQSGASRAIASSGGAMLTSVSNSDGTKTTTLASGIVLTTVDGMTAEKAAQAISSRILELNGTPFYIEEGGMVKEIIAVVKDGKVLLDDKGNPIFEKIVKGKVGDKKFAKIKDKERAPASITDVADLKRDQEEKLKRERAEYMKLKSLTNEALKKK